MTTRTQPNLLSQISSQIPDNTTRQVTPANVRGVLIDVADSLGNQCLDVRRFGALGNDANDDTAAIQAALDQSAITGQKVRIPAGVYRITQTLIYRGGGTVEGDGKNSTFLDWYGATEGTLLQISGAWNYALRDFCLRNKLGAQGTTFGIKVEKIEDDFGTTSGGANWDMLAVYSFRIGVVLGNQNRSQSTSELHLNHFTASFCWCGIQMNDWNTLDILCTMLEMAHNEVGLAANQAGSVHILGGSATANTERDFAFNPGGIWSIYGFRSELTKRLVWANGTTAAGRLTVQDCYANIDPVGADGILIELQGGAFHTIAGNYLLGGHVFVNNASNRLVMRDNMVADSVLLQHPPALPVGATGFYRLSNNVRIDASGGFVEDFPDESGTWPLP